MLKVYDENMNEMLPTVFPEHDWQSWRFRQSTEKFTDFESEKKALTYLEKRFEINKPEDWNKISVREFQKLGGGKLLKNYSSLSAFLAAHYPGYK